MNITHPMSSSAHSIARRPRRAVPALDRMEADVFFTTDRARIARFRSPYIGQVTKTVVSSAADNVRIVLTTIGSDADALPLARALVDERLAACVNILPAMVSIYRWKGLVEEDHEHQVIIKTTADRLAALEARIRQMHPYELPEFLVFAVTGEAAYLTWIRESVVSQSQPAKGPDP
jgi:periplasmic divalent cation tolerance protein